MKFSPLTRQVELELSNPERLVEAMPGTFFYRSGNDLFYLISGNNRRRIEISKKSFALKYQNQIWYATINDDSIVFQNNYELWQKTGTKFNSTGWKYISNKSLSLENN